MNGFMCIPFVRDALEPRARLGELGDRREQRAAIDHEDPKIGDRQRGEVELQAAVREGQRRREKAREARSSYLQAAVVEKHVVAPSGARVARLARPQRGAAVDDVHDAARAKLPRGEDLSNV